MIGQVNPPPVDLLLSVYACSDSVAQVLQRLGSQHVLVVHSEDGLDEISIAAPTNISELHNGVITNYTVTPEKFGVPSANLNQIQVHSVDESVTMVHSVLDNQANPARDAVVLNAGAAIYAADLTNSFAEGVAKAQTVLSSGAAHKKLTAWCKLSQSF